MKRHVFWHHIAPIFLIHEDFTSVSKVDDVHGIVASHVLYTHTQDNIAVTNGTRARMLGIYYWSIAGTTAKHDNQNDPSEAKYQSVARGHSPRKRRINKQLEYQIIERERPP